MFLKLKENTNN